MPLVEIIAGFGILTLVLTTFLETRADLAEDADALLVARTAVSMHGALERYTREYYPELSLCLGAGDDPGPPPTPVSAVRRFDNDPATASGPETGLFVAIPLFDNDRGATPPVPALAGSQSLTAIRCVNAAAGGGPWADEYPLSLEAAGLLPPALASLRYEAGADSRSDVWWSGPRFDGVAFRAAARLISYERAADEPYRYGVQALLVLGSRAFESMDPGFADRVASHTATPAFGYVTSNDQVASVDVIETGAVTVTYSGNELIRGMAGGWNLRLCGSGTPTDLAIPALGGTRATAVTLGLSACAPGGIADPIRTLDFETANPVIFSLFTDADSDEMTDIAGRTCGPLGTTAACGDERARVVALVHQTSSATLEQVLYRRDIGIPEANRMRVDLDFGGHGGVNVAYLTGTDTDSDGLVDHGIHVVGPPSGGHVATGDGLHEFPTVIHGDLIVTGHTLFRGGVQIGDPRPQDAATAPFGLGIASGVPPAGVPRDGFGFDTNLQPGDLWVLSETQVGGTDFRDGNPSAVAASATDRGSGEHGFAYVERGMQIARVGSLSLEVGRPRVVGVSPTPTPREQLWVYSGVQVGDGFDEDVGTTDGQLFATAAIQVSDPATRAFVETLGGGAPGVLGLVRGQIYAERGTQVGGAVDDGIGVAREGQAYIATGLQVGHGTAAITATTAFDDAVGTEDGQVYATAAVQVGDDAFNPGLGAPHTGTADVGQIYAQRGLQVGGTIDLDVGDLDGQAHIASGAQVGRGTRTAADPFDATVGTEDGQIWSTAAVQVGDAAFDPGLGAPHAAPHAAGGVGQFYVQRGAQVGGALDTDVGNRPGQGYVAQGFQVGHGRVAFTATTAFDDAVGTQDGQVYATAAVQVGDDAFNAGLGAPHTGTADVGQIYAQRGLQVGGTIDLDVGDLDGQAHIASGAQVGRGARTAADPFDATVGTADGQIWATAAVQVGDSAFVPALGGTDPGQVYAERGAQVGGAVDVVVGADHEGQAYIAHGLQVGHGGAANFATATGAFDRDVGDEDGQLYATAAVQVSARPFVETLGATDRGQFYAERGAQVGGAVDVNVGDEREGQAYIAAGLQVGHSGDATFATAAGAFDEDVGTTDGQVWATAGVQVSDRAFVETLGGANRGQVYAERGAQVGGAVDVVVGADHEGQAYIAHGLQVGHRGATNFATATGAFDRDVGDEDGQVYATAAVQVSGRAFAEGLGATNRGQVYAERGAQVGGAVDPIVGADHEGQAYVAHGLQVGHAGDANFATATGAFDRTVGDQDGQIYATSAVQVSARAFAPALGATNRGQFYAERGAQVGGAVDVAVGRDREGQAYMTSGLHVGDNTFENDVGVRPGQVLIDQGLQLGHNFDTTVGASDGEAWIEEGLVVGGPNFDEPATGQYFVALTDEVTVGATDLAISATTGRLTAQTGLSDATTRATAHNAIGAGAVTAYHEIDAAASRVRGYNVAMNPADVYYERVQQSGALAARIDNYNTWANSIPGVYIRAVRGVGTGTATPCYADGSMAPSGLAAERAAAVTGWATTLYPTDNYDTGAPYSGITSNPLAVTLEGEITLRVGTQSAVANLSWTLPAFLRSAYAGWSSATTTGLDNSRGRVGTASAAGHVFDLCDADGSSTALP